MFSSTRKFDEKENENYIAVIKDKNKKITGYVKFDKKQNHNVLKSDDIFQPCFNFVDKREIMYIVGRSGSGKSYFTNNVAEIYHALYPDRVIYYITKVKYEEGDPSLNKKLYLFVDIDKFLYNIRNGLAEKDDFKNSLVIFDDIGSVKGQDEKTLFYWIDLCLEVFRKNNCSLILCNHLSTEYKKTRLILMEMTKYVCFNNMKTRSDRVLLSYIEMTKQEVRNMLNIDSRYYCIDTVSNYVISEHEIYKIE